MSMIGARDTPEIEFCWVVNRMNLQPLIYMFFKLTVDNFNSYLK